MIKSILIENDDEDFFVEIKIDDKHHDIEGSVYPILKFTDHKTKQEDWGFLSKEGNGETFPKINDACRVLFTFTYCYRGVWDGRIYFPNEEEYFNRELKMMSEIWDTLEPMLKDKIRELKPNIND